MALNETDKDAISYFNLRDFDVVREWVSSFPCYRKDNFIVKQYATIFDIKQNNVEAKGNVASFFGVNKTSICMAGICPKFPFKQLFIYMYLFIHFHCPSINFKLKVVIFTNLGHRQKSA